MPQPTQPIQQTQLQMAQRIIPIQALTLLILMLVPLIVMVMLNAKVLMPTIAASTHGTNILAKLNKRHTHAQLIPAL